MQAEAREKEALELLAQGPAEKKKKKVFKSKTTAGLPG